MCQINNNKATGIICSFTIKHSEDHVFGKDALTIVFGLAGEYLSTGDKKFSRGGYHWESKKENGARPPCDSKNGYHRKNCPAYRCCSLKVNNTWPNVFMLAAFTLKLPHQSSITSFKNSHHCNSCVFSFIQFSTIQQGRALCHFEIWCWRTFQRARRWRAGASGMFF